MKDCTRHENWCNGYGEQTQCFLGEVITEREMEILTDRANEYKPWYQGGCLMNFIRRELDSYNFSHQISWFEDDYCSVCMYIMAKIINPDYEYDEEDF